MVRGKKLFLTKKFMMVNFVMAKNTVMADLYLLMDLSIQETFQIIKKKDKELKLGQMVKNMKELGIKTNNMGKVFLNGLVGENIQGTMY